jgi:hypothetical protein
MDIIRKTLQNTTQLGQTILRFPMQRHIKARFPWLNCNRLRETVATDTYFANVRAIGGATCAQVFYGVQSHMINVYGMKSESEMPDTYMDFIREEGAPSILRRDNLQIQSGTRTTRLNRQYFIRDEFTEPGHPQQNPAELRAVKYLKDHTQVLLDRTSAPEICWLLGCEYIADVHNICADESIGYRIPREVRHGGLQDISAFLEYKFYEPILYLDSEESFPSSKEKAGWWVGVAHNVGDAMTFKILTRDTQQVVHRSVIRPAKDDKFKNKRVLVDPVPISSELPDDDPVSANDTPSLVFGQRRLKIDKGLSKRRNRKQLRRQARHPNSILPPVTEEASTSNSDDTNVAVNGGDMATSEDESDDEPIPIIDDKPQAHSKVYDVEDLSLNTPKGEIATENTADPIYDPNYDTGDPKADAHHGGDVPDDNGLRRSRRQTQPSNRMTFNARTVKSSLKSLIRGFLLGMAVHSNYDRVKPQNVSCDNENHVLNRNPTQFNLGTLHKQELDKLRELQELDMVNDMMDPDPDDHIWRCIAVTKHKIRDLDKDDIHVKVKALWGDGEETWVRSDALRLQDPSPLIEYAVKRRLTKHPLWEWAEEYLKDDDRMASMVQALKAKVNGVQYMFGVEIPRNAKHALEMDKANGNNLWKESIDKELEMINQFQTFRRLRKGETLTLDYKRVPYFIVFANKFHG